MSDGRLRTFANFRIRDILDVDLVSTTYRATTVDGNESRRLRVFTSDVADDESARIQHAVVAEALRARSVRHPHILAIHHADREHDQAYVVSDDIHGAVLRDFIVQHHPLKPSTALAMAWQLAEALDAVHAGGVVHGGINPHTIWVADSPGRPVPMTYLTGFGASQVLARHLMSANGVPAADDLLYVEVGQAQQGQATPEADRYALACAVYHLMTGVPPFQRGTVDAHRFDAVEPPSSVRREVPPTLDSVFARGLAEQSSDRYPSASALMIAVERGLRGQEETRLTRRLRHPDAVPAGDEERRVEPPSAGAPPAPVAHVAEPGSGTVDAVPVDDVDAVPVDDGSAARDTSAPPSPTYGAPPREQEPPADRAPEHMTPAASDEDADAAVVANGRQGPAATEVRRWRAAVAADPAVMEAGSAVADEPTDGSGDADEPTDGSGDAGGHTEDNGDAADLEHAGPLERRRAAALEARHASWQMRDGPRPATVLRPRPALPVADEPAPRRRFAGLQPRMLALVAGVLVVVAAGTAGLIALRGRSDGQAAPAPEAEPGRREQPATVRPLWTTPVAERRIRAIATSDAAVVVAGGDTVGALDPTSGTRLWGQQAPARVAGIAAVRGVAGVRTADGISGYDVDSGTPRWTVGNTELGAPDGTAAVVAGGGTLYTAARNGTDIVLSEIDPSDGEAATVTTISGDASGEGRSGLALAFARGSNQAGPTLYALTPAALHAVDIETGRVRWQAPAPDGAVAGSPRLRARPWVDSLAVAAGAAVVVDRDGMVCRHAAASGEQVWSTCQEFPPGPAGPDADGPAALEAAPTLLIGGGRVVVASADAIATYDFTNGMPQWNETTRGPAQSVVAGGDTLLYMARSEAVIALEHDSGRERWRASGVEGVTTLAADDDGVFAGLSDGSVVRLVERAVAQGDVQ